MSNTNVIPAVRIAAMTLAIVCANQGYAAAAEAEAPRTPAPKLADGTVDFGGNGI